MKQKVFFILAMLLGLLVPQGAKAYSFSSVAPTGQTLYYRITGDDGNDVSVTYGSYSGWYTEPSGDLEIPSSVTYNGITYTVTSIDEYTFDDCTGLTSITIPNSVTSIGEWAFGDCTGLTSITIPNSVTSIGERAFSGCTGLTSVTIGNSVRHIEQSAFYGCSGLTGALTIPNSVISIGNYAFDNCTSLTSVTIPNSVTSIGYCVFAGCTGLTSVTIGNSVTSIGTSAFEDCTGLTSVTIPNSVTSISSDAFSGCTGLTSVTIGNSVTSIGDWAFSGCTGLTSVTIPNSVTSIGDYAFYGCSGLTSVTIPNSVTSIGNSAFSSVGTVFYSGGLTGCPWGASACNGFIADSLIYIDATKNEVVSYVRGLSNANIPNSVTSIRGAAFYGCSGLTSVTIPNSVTSIRGAAFSGCTGLTTFNYNADSCTSVSSNWLNGCTSLTTLNIGNNVRIIPNYFAYNCSGLTSVTIPNSVTSIGEYAFQNCSGLTSVTIGNSVTSIGVRAFSGCSGLTSLTIPNSVSSIGGYAFYGCSGLTGALTIPNSVTSIGNNAFNGCSGLTTLNFNAESCGGSGFSTNYHWLGGCPSLSTVNIGNNVRIIPTKFAYNCSGLTSVTIPDSVTRIESYAFYGCTGLTSVTIPDLVTRIESYAFYGCTGLTSVTIPNSVTRIGDYAFRSCTGLTLVNMQSITPPSIGSDVFLNTPSVMVVEIPCNTLSAYQQSWGTGFTFNERRPVFSVSLQSNYSERGDVSIQQQNGYDIACDSTSILVATPIYGYSFSHWENNLLLTDNPRTVSLTQDTQFVAYFQKNVYTLTFQSDNTQWGTVSVDSVSGEYLDTSTQIYANPIPHYHLVQWSDGSTENPRRIVFTEDLSYTAYFAIDTHSVVVQTNDIARGTVDGGGVFIYGTPCVVSATPYTGYIFQGWSNGVTANPYTFAAVEDVTLTAIFVAPGEMTHTVTVSVNDATMGSATANGSTTAVVADGATVTLVATPNTGYTFTQWQDGNTQNPCTVTVTADTTYTAYFEAVATTQYTVTVNVSNAAMGSATVNGTATATVTDGTTVVLAATAFPGYTFTQWQDGNTQNPRTVTITADTTYTAYFTVSSATQYTVTADVNDASMGSATVNGAATATVTDGTTVVLAATAFPGYTFTQWQDGNTDNPRTVTVTGNATYMAYFAADQSNAPQIAYVGVDSNGHNAVSWTPQSGTSPVRYNVYREGIQAGVYELVGVVNASGAASYSWTDDQSNPATRAYSYRLAEVAADNTESDLSIPHTTIHLQINQGQGDAWNLAWTPYVGFNYSTYNLYRGTDASSMTLLTTLPATATTYSDLNTGGTAYYYQIEVVQLSGAKTTAVSSRSNIVTTDPDPQTYTLTVLSADVLRGTVTGGGSYTEGTMATLTAEANEGYVFLQWQDGSTANPRNILVTANGTYMAYFTQTEGIADAEGSNVTITARNGRIQVSGAEGCQVTLSDALGRILYRGTATEPLTVEAPATGIYLLQVEGHPAHRISVVR